MRSKGLRQICLAGFFAILATLVLAGCGSGHSGGGGGGGAGTGYATLSWRIYDIEAPTYTGPGLACNVVGATQVSVTLTSADRNVAPYTQTTPCAYYAVTTASIPTGSYTATFTLLGDPAIYGNAAAVLDSFPADGTFHILAGANDFTQTSYAPFVVQSFTVSWGIYSGTTPTSCAAVGATYVYLDFLVAGASTWVMNAFDCTVGAGTSYAIPWTSGTVQWSLSLVNAAGNDIQVLPVGAVTLPATTNVNLTAQYFSF
jgi:hypothetical protein